MKKLLPLFFLLLGLATAPAFAHAADYPDGCTATTAYSATTGHPCTLPDCAPGDLFSGVTGKPCGGTGFLPGCWSLIGYSVTTGTKCDTPAQSVAPTVAPVNTGTATVVQPASDVVKGHLSISGGWNAFQVSLFHYTKDSTDLEIEQYPDRLKEVDTDPSYEYTTTTCGTDNLCNTVKIFTLTTSTSINSPQFPNDDYVYTFKIKAFGQEYIYSTTKTTTNNNTKLFF